MKRFWPQFSSLLAFQLQLNDCEVMLNKTKKQKLRTEKEKLLQRVAGVAWMSEYIPLVGSLSYRQPLSISFFRMHHVSAEGGGGAQSRGYRGEGAHGVKFVCLMMWTYVGCELTRKTSVTSVQTQMIQARAHACGGKNKLMCACMP